MIDHILQRITDLGDSAVTASLTALVVLGCLVIKEQRAALAIMGTFALTALAMALVKIFFYSDCASALSSIHSPSGHSALSLATYGTLASIIARSLPLPWRPIPYLIAIPLILCIAVSRILLGAHNGGEVVMGLGIGGIITFAMTTAVLKNHKVNQKILGIIPIAFIFIFLMNGLHFPAEQIIAHLGRFLHHQAHVCDTVSYLRRALLLGIT